jgi:cysteine desulfurase / selenocysteine lyase
MMDKFTEIRKLFPVTEKLVHLNNAAVSPCPPFIYREAVRVLEGYGTSGGELEAGWHNRLAEIRGSLARLVGAEPGEIFLSRNTSEGLILAARGFRWRPGDTVVCLQGEFPAVTVPLSLLAGQGVNLRLVPPRPDNTWALEDIEAALDPGVRMLVLSFVEFHTGFRHDLAALGRLCRERDIFFVVDGVQGVGALATDLHAWGVDLLSAAGHKWLLSPEGTGFVFLRREKLDRLDPLFCSWISLEDPFDFLARGVTEARFDKPLRGDARRFEGGTLNVSGFTALGRSVETLLELGSGDIETHILSLGARAAAGLLEKGYEVTSPQGPGRRSGITCFRSRRRNNAELLAGLRICGFSLGFPCGSIRVSPHYYNNEDDIDRLLEALPPE